MKGKLTNNLALKLVSVVVAFLIWATVVNISNPEVIRSKTVPVTILNGKLLTNAGKTYTVVGGDSVTVSYKVRTRDAYRISEDNFRATADMAALYTVTGSVPVEVEVTGNRELIVGTPTVRPASLQVSTEDLQNKSFSLATRVLGTPAEGFSVGSMTVDPQTVMVSGPVSIVGRISSVGVEVDVTGASGDLEGSAPITFFDANGNRFEITDNRLTTDPEMVSYKIHMLRGKTLALDFQAEGQAAPGYRFTGVECSVKSIGVVGERSILDKLDSLTVSGSEISVNNSTQDKIISVDLNNYLPPGVSIIGNSDNHIKNLSLLYSEDLRNIRLAPLYDVISTVVYDGSTREMSVSIDGKYSIDEITRESFANQAEKVHLGKKAAMKRFDRLQNGFEKALNEAAYELKEEGFKNAETIRDAVLAHRRMR